MLTGAYSRVPMFAKPENWPFCTTDKTPENPEVGAVSAQELPLDMREVLCTMEANIECPVKKG